MNGTNSENSKRYAWLEDIFSGTINYLKSCPGICEVKVGSRMSISESQIKSWENANSPFLLPKDLKAFYCFSDGLLINWNIQFKDEVIPIGQMQVNSLEKLSKIHISMNEKLMNHFNSYFFMNDKSYNNNNNAFYNETSSCIISQDNFYDTIINIHDNYITNGNIMSGYLLYDCKNYGKVILLYHSKLKADPQIWFIDSNNEWNFVSLNFISYFRLMVKNYGIYGWQLAYTKKGLYQSTQDWLSFYAPDRILFYNQHRDRLKENYKIENYDLNYIKNKMEKENNEKINAGDNAFNPHENNNEHELFLLKYFGSEKNYNQMLNYKTIKKAQLK
ncbi:hypothetical protein BCR36DRAFT_343625 [Piromyces finnis]|uniref:Knr4/Smi1-like domain-containing protein n=1 Tax=Piromyces finnis TaxID=1754191 RepID=A0A1Y1VK08_9FUNG|nr:hypothetical protein BCR36DRAFT_343625 [Piromyces finnis]|eukprot:ORX58430.1 hypothetical protein BCR36DRAFT_343625 [Piromyces finnis]